VEMRYADILCCCFKQASCVIMFFVLAVVISGLSR